MKTKIIVSVRKICEKCRLIQGITTMKIRVSVRKICQKCRIIRRRGHIIIICYNPRMRIFYNTHYKIEQYDMVIFRLILIIFRLILIMLILSYFLNR